MKKVVRTNIISLLFLLTLPVTVVAMPITYNFTLTASGGVEVTGMFTGEDANADGWIRSLEVDDLSYEVRQGGALVGAAAGLSATTNTATYFQFNYHVPTMLFATTGSLAGPSGNGWCWSECGSQWSLGLDNGALYVRRSAPFVYPIIGRTLTAQQTSAASAVPAPPPIALLGAGLIALGCARQRKRKKSALHS